MKRFLVIATLAVALTGCGFEVVDTGYRGVQTTWGKVHNESLPEGLHWYAPWSDNIIEMDVRTLKWEFDTMVYTKDIQQAKLNVVVTYSLDPVAAPVVLETLGNDWAEKIVGQDVYEKIKNVSGQYEAAHLISERSKAVQQMLEEVREVLGPKHVKVQGLAVTNIDFDDAYEKAVERKVVADQDALAAINKTKAVKEEGEQNKARALADAEAMRARASAIKENQSLIEWEKLQVQKLAIQQWKGQVPQYQFGGGGVVPFMNVEPAK
jgi:regulator of protease activity HflC (stomatin/prohibitin superfamily)